MEPPLPEMMVLRDTITEVYIDTHTVYKPVPYKVEIKDTVYLSNNESIESDCQNKHAQGTLFVQEIKWFSDNSTYDMQVSGINVQLNWIKTYPKTVYETIIETKTETIYVTPKPLSFWGGVEFMSCGNRTALPVTIEARYAKKNEEYCAGVGYDVINSVRIIKASAKRKF